MIIWTTSPVEAGSSIGIVAGWKVSDSVGCVSFVNRILVLLGRYRGAARTVQGQYRSTISKQKMRSVTFRGWANAVVQLAPRHPFLTRCHTSLDLSSSSSTNEDFKIKSVFSMAATTLALEIGC